MSEQAWRHPWQVVRCARTVHQPLTAVCSHRWEVTAWWHARLMWDRPGWHHDIRPTPAHPQAPR